MKNAIIIGAGPAGLFAAYKLIKAGVAVTILEMGKEMKDRSCPGKGKCLCKTCDILEGIGGAGGFSDGKNTFSLTRGTQLEEIFDPRREETLDEVKNVLFRHAPEHGIDVEPLNEVPGHIQKSPFKMESYSLNHMGTDGIQAFIKSFAASLRGMGVEIMSRTRALSILRDSPKVHKVFYVTGEGETGVLRANQVIIATGLQGHPWLEEQCLALGIKRDHGPAGFGIRLEAEAGALEPLFNIFYDFKMTFESNGILFRSFCCNRNGYIVNENHNTLGIRNVNGHSYLDGEKSDFSNFAIIAKLSRSHETPQNYVRSIARGINSRSEGTSVVQRMDDFLSGRPSTEDGTSRRTNKLAAPGVDLRGCMSFNLANGFKDFIRNLFPITNGLDKADAFVYAPEVKYFGYKSPVDFDTWRVVGRPGIYIIGNASGYLDSFISAALTGFIAAEDIIRS